MTLCNEIYKVGKINKKEYQTLVLLVSPFAPHIAEEIWERCKFEPEFKNASWPTFDESALVKDVINLPVQINGKMRGTIEVGTEESQEAIVEKIKNEPSLSKYLENSVIKKIILVPNRIINIIC